MTSQALDQLPGFRRRFRVTPGAGSISAEVEDDYHCMGVVLHVVDGVALRVEPVMRRAPWNTCPGAVAQLEATFTGTALEDFPAAVAEKSANCTHLFDLAQMAARYAAVVEPVIFDVLVSDPVDGVRHAELRRNGSRVTGWSERDMCIVAPDEMAGIALFAMKPWLQTLAGEALEAAKILRWANMMANGRSIPLEDQSDATRMPPNCYTFQPDRAATAHRVGEVKDFSNGTEVPLMEHVTNL
ncbi:DUF2889 domain-containing protein [Haliea sp. E17]|uniref:DUF2889 domain-containing protein n=1 Tax=Haliea sp. E17 TaxID=3401576 RepID=UPI003AB02006